MINIYCLDCVTYRYDFVVGEYKCVHPLVELDGPLPNRIDHCNHKITVEEVIEMRRESPKEVD